MIDAHCHLDDQRLDGLRHDWLRQARAAGIQRHVIAGVSPEQWAGADRLAHAEADCAVVYGLHPEWVAAGGEWEAGLRALGDRRPTRLGECGLDARLARTEAQMAAFRAQLALARALDVPVVLHVVGRHGLALDVLRRDGAPSAGGLVHAFTGGLELAREYVAMGLALSFCGTVVPRGGEPQGRWVAAARWAPEHALLAETDAPDQAPPGVAPGRSWLPEVIAALAAARQAPVARLRALTRDNAERVLRLPEVRNATPPPEPPHRPAGALAAPRQRETESA